MLSCDEVRAAALADVVVLGVVSLRRAQHVTKTFILLPTMSDLLDDAAKRASRYLESLGTRSVAPAKEAIAALASFDQALPEHVDAQGRMRLDAFPDVDDRTIVCVQAGNVNSGAFDPIPEICERAHASGAWVHVDGAFGMWAAAAPARGDCARPTRRNVLLRWHGLAGPHGDAHQRVVVGND
jgi:hypothetical protein